MTVGEAKQLLNVNSDKALADILGITRQAVFQWRGTVPDLRRYQIEALARGN